MQQKNLGSEQTSLYFSHSFKSGETSAQSHRTYCRIGKGQHLCSPSSRHIHSDMIPVCWRSAIWTWDIDVSQFRIRRRLSEHEV